MRPRPTLASTLLSVLIGCTGGDGPGDAGGVDGGPAGDASARDAGNADAGAADAGRVPETCPGGAALLHYSMTPVDPLPALAAIDLPNLHPATIITSAGGGESESLRFDLCEGGEGPVLHGVLYREHSFSVPRRYVVDATVGAPVRAIVQSPMGLLEETRLPPSSVQLEGLAAAIAGDLRTFRLRLMSESGLVMAGHDGFIAVGLGRIGATEVEYTSLTVLVGGLAPGDVFAGLTCGFGEQELSAAFRLGTARFELGGCSFFGGGATLGYRLHRLAVEDSSEALNVADRERFEFATIQEVEAVLNYRWNHHNACDSFYLALPHAEYAASTSPAAGCGPQVENAPERHFGEPDGGPVRYRMRYYGGPWIDGETDACSHYLGCPD